METILIKALQLILSLSILVIVHEFGHFIFARMFKVRVEKFYLFFNPWFTLFKFKPKNSETEYGLGWLPLGGYVKIAGMIDESMDKEQMAQPPKPWEFRSKPAGQRLLIMVGGVLMNFLLAFFIYAMVLLAWGDSYIPLRNMANGMEFSQAAKDAGFRNGDILLAADGVELDRMGSTALLSIVEAKEVTVLRDGVRTEINVPADFMQRLIVEGKGFMSPRYPFKVEKVKPDSPAALAGIQAGDSIVGAGESTDMFFSEISKMLEEKKGQTLSLNLYRNNELTQVDVTPDSTGIIGVLINTDIYQTVTTRYNFFSAFPAGIHLGVEQLKSYVAQFKYVFTKEGAQSLGGFGTIASIFPETWNWYKFWMMTAFLSIILGFMNILPIPALDGGHVLFLLYEVVTRRKPNEKFLEYAQIAGMVLLFGLLIYANGNDIFKAFFK